MCLAEFGKLTDFEPLGNRMFVAWKWFLWDLGVVMAKFGFCKQSFIQTRSCSFVYGSSVTAFVLQQQNRTVVKETRVCSSGSDLWPARPSMFAVGALLHKSKGTVVITSVVLK